MSLDAWKHAESCVGDPDAIPAAAKTLAPKPAAILRAMEALDRGDTEQIRALADALRTEHADVAAVLDVAIAPRGGAEPSLWRDAPETVELPLPDLLEVFAAAREGLPVRPSPRLTEEAGYRPVLHAVFTLLTDDRSELYANPIVRTLMPRASELMLAARAQQMLGHTAEDRLRQWMGDLTLKLLPDRWPKITDERDPGDLDWWSRSRAPWTAHHDATVSELLAGPETTRQAALGTILRRVRRDLPHGRLGRMARPVRAAVSLAWCSEVPDELKVQLGVLQLRVDHFDPEVQTSPMPLLLSLWSQSLEDAARVVVAEALLEAPRAELPAAVLAEASLRAVARTQTSEAAGEYLLDLCARLPPQRLIDGLAEHGAPPHRARHIAALHAASAGFATVALSAIPALLDRTRGGRPDPDEVAVHQIARTVTGTLSRREDLPAKAMDAVTETGASLALHRCSAVPWGPFVATPRWAEAITPRDRDVALKRVRASSTDPAELAASLLIAARWGDAEVMSSSIRSTGRRLRQMAPPDAEDLVLHALGWVYAWNGDEARSLTRTHLRPLSRFLLRKGGAPASAASARLPTTGPTLAGALDWYFFEAQDVTDAGAWRGLLRGMLAVPDDLRKSFVRLSNRADLSDARGLAAAVATLQDALQSIVDRGDHV